MRAVSIKAVLVSFAFLLVTTLVFVAIALAIANAVIEPQGSADVRSFVLQRALKESPLFQWLAPTVGGLLIVATGYIAAWVAKRAEPLNGVLAATVPMLVEIYAIVASRVEYATYWQALFVAATPLLGAFGGRLRRWQIRRISSRA
jgi:hypothetical protein